MIHKLKLKTAYKTAVLKTSYKRAVRKGREDYFGLRAADLEGSANPERTVEYMDASWKLLRIQRALNLIAWALILPIIWTKIGVFLAVVLAFWAITNEMSRRGRGIMFAVGYYTGATVHHSRVIRLFQENSTLLGALHNIALNRDDPQYISKTVNTAIEKIEADWNKEEGSNV